MKFLIREFNKDKAQETMDKLFMEINGYKNPSSSNVIKDKYKKKKR
jgi:hypothetical protein